MAENTNKTTIILSILLIICIVGFLYIYLFRYRTLSDEVVSLQNQIAQLQTEITNLKSGLQEPETTARVPAVISEKVQNIGEIYFSPGYVLLDKKTKEDLDEIANRLQNFPDAVIQLIGHSDNTPVGRNLSVEYPTNWELSIERALTTAHYLQKRYGMEPTSFVIVGLSSTQPKGSNESIEGRSQNRRVEIKIVEK